MTFAERAASSRRIARTAFVQLLFRHAAVWKLSQRFNKYFYPYLTRRLADDEPLFLNFGYEESPPMHVPLTERDEPNRTYIQLYHRTATQVDLDGKHVLEVGCGHGGGASYIVRALQPAAYTGLDLNSVGVALCRAQHNIRGLKFVQGDAESLPFDDHDFDVVINIESSHCYPRFSRFLAEVARVLRSGGHFLYADYRPSSCVGEWDAAIADAPLRLISARVINDEILRGMGKNSTRTLELNRQLPAPLRATTREISGLPGSYAYNHLQSGGLSYRMYAFVKD